MNPTVVWTYRAETRLHFLVLQLKYPEMARIGIQADFTARLREAYRDATDVIVLDLYLGFRPRPGEVTLLIDDHYRQPDDGGTIVVKLADDSRLRIECDAWRNTKPPQFNGDAVFMRLRPIYDSQDRHRLIAVEYKDAEPHIGLAKQMFLEEAFIGAVRYGYPTVESVVDVLETLFEHLRQHLYRGAAPSTPFDKDLLLNSNRGESRRPLVTSLATWDRDGAVEVVQLVDDEFQSEDAGFRNPVTFFQTASEALASGSSGDPYRIPLTRGPAHGDLHGRNVLVGVNDDRAVKPAVYDYEHMAHDHLLGLEFAKLETELKIRAYRYVFPFTQAIPALPPPEFVHNLQAMERQMWKPDSTPPPSGPAQRFYILLRKLRGLTARYLGEASRNQIQWHREYQLLLAAYGVYSVRFPQNYTERTVAFISAGVAAERYTTSLEQ
jgi:hypothetical protein